MCWFEHVRPLQADDKNGRVGAREFQDCLHHCRALLVVGKGDGGVTAGGAYLHCQDSIHHRALEPGPGHSAATWPVAFAGAWWQEMASAQLIPLNKAGHHFENVTKLWLHICGCLLGPWPAARLKWLWVLIKSRVLHAQAESSALCFLVVFAWSATLTH